MFKVVYKDELKLEHNIIKGKKNILSWKSDVKNNQLPIIKIGWEFIWCLIRAKLKGDLYFLTKFSLRKDSVYYDFFTIKK